MRDTKIAPTANIVLRSIADDKSMTLFRAIAQSKDEVNIKSLKKDTKLTRKQYYVRLARMVKSGLVKRRRKSYVLTTFGKIVYYSQKRVDTVWSDLQKMKDLDSFETTSNTLSKSGPRQLVDNLFGTEKNQV